MALERQQSHGSDGQILALRLILKMVKAHAEAVEMLTGRSEK